MKDLIPATSWDGVSFRYYTCQTIQFLCLISVTGFYWKYFPPNINTLPLSTSEIWILMSGTDLLKRLQRNDAGALTSLMWLYYDDLYNYGARFTTDKALVKDCIQEIFISLWQRRETADTILSPKFYLLRAIKNKILKSLHKNNYTTLTTKEYDFSYELSIEQIIIEKQVNEEKIQKLRKTLEHLSKKQKEIVYLKYYHHLDHSQIAELMNVTRQTVYNLLHETLHKLRSLLKADFIAQ